MVGVPLNTDKLTKTMERVDYARVLIETDVTKQLPKVVTIKLPNGESFEQKVDYEYVPFFCDVCNAIGHTRDRCPRIMINNKVDHVDPVKQVTTEAVGKATRAVHPVQRTNEAPRSDQNVSGTAVNLQAKDSGKEVAKEQSGQQIDELLDQNIPDQCSDDLLAEQWCRARLAKAIKEVKELEQLASDDVQIQQNLIIKRRRRDKLAAAIRFVEETSRETEAASRIAEPGEASSTMNVAGQNENKFFAKEQGQQNVLIEGTSLNTVTVRRIKNRANIPAAFDVPLCSKYAVLSGIVEDGNLEEGRGEVDKAPKRKARK